MTYPAAQSGNAAPAGRTRAGFWRSNACTSRSSVSVTDPWSEFSIGTIASIRLARRHRLGHRGNRRRRNKRGLRRIAQRRRLRVRPRRSKKRQSAWPTRLGGHFSPRPSVPAARPPHAPATLPPSSAAPASITVSSFGTSGRPSPCTISDNNDSDGSWSDPTVLPMVVASSDTITSTNS